jgi:glyoxylase-like metal-dependent hydrolase (beta-lactamase superfamily II)
VVAHLTEAAAALLDELPAWVRLVRAPNPGPLTLDGTNTWVLRTGPDEAATVIDPGPLDEGHLGAIVDAGPVDLILVTHGHPDHLDGLDWLAARTGAVAVPPGVPMPARAESGLYVERIDTPGHTADSVCFVASPRDSPRVIFTGDTILGRGTAIVAWPDGNLRDYLATLEHLATYSGVAAMPGHGPALTDCGVAARYYHAHRLARLEQVRAAIASGARTPEEVVEVVYADVDRSLWTAAEWSVRAQLSYLDEQ